MSARSTRQFIDTNILIYAHDRSAGQKHDQARELMRELWQLEAGCLGIQILQEFYVNITQKVPQPLPSQSAAQIVDALNLVHWPPAPCPLPPAS